ncbi:MAG: SDR family NAD(P)-dependent oxidoreductase [Pseudomonadota bacterium]
MGGDSADFDAKRVLVLGASGTIGRAVVRALITDGHSVVAALRRSPSGEAAADELGRAGAVCRFGDVSDPASISRDLFAGEQRYAVISCLASRSGTAKDAQAIDYQANASVLAAAKQAGVKHFILLSAICVQKPLLAFQRAKLALEAELVASGLTWSIVRPTAFFKSLSGQVARVAAGKPFMVFGSGELTRCKPISDRDLARFIAGCIGDPARHNQLLPIGGPGPAVSPLDQAAMLGAALDREVRVRRVPVAMMSAFAGLFALGERWSGWCAEKAEYARIARYYATESMLVLHPETGQYDADMTPEFGQDTLRDHYNNLLKDAQ